MSVLNESLSEMKRHFLGFSGFTVFIPHLCTNIIFLQVTSKYNKVVCNANIGQELQECQSALLGKFC